MFKCVLNSLCYVIKNEVLYGNDNKFIIFLGCLNNYLFP